MARKQSDLERLEALGWPAAHYTPEGKLVIEGETVQCGGSQISDPQSKANKYMAGVN